MSLAVRSLSVLIEESSAKAGFIPFAAANHWLTSNWWAMVDYWEILQVVLSIQRSIQDQSSLRVNLTKRAPSVETEASKSNA